MKEQAFEVDEIEEEGRALVEMYQAGYLDGFIDAGRTKYNKFSTDYKNPRVRKACRKAFERRFAKKVQKEIDKKNKHKVQG